SGPVLKRDLLRISYLVAAEYSTTNDYMPSSEEKYTATDDYLRLLNSSPLIPANYGGTFRRSEFTRLSDLETTTVHPGAERDLLGGYGRIDLSWHDRIHLTAGSFIRLNDQDLYLFDNALFNASENPEVRENGYDNFIRFNHTLKKTGRFQLDYNLFFQYSHLDRKVQNKRHEDRFFEYGYLGRYITYKDKAYSMGSIEIDGVLYEDVLLLNSWDYDTAIVFQDMGYNPAAAAYTRSVYEFFPADEINNEDDLMLRGGLLNGSLIPGVYPGKGLWNSPGTIRNTDHDDYSKQKYQEYRGVFSTSALFRTGSITHRTLFSFGYDQSVQREYGIQATELWTLARGLTNYHILELDLGHPYPVMDNGVFQGMINFPRRYDAGLQTAFDRMLRSRLGLPLDGTEFILTDSYDMTHHTISYFDSEGVMVTISAPDDLLGLELFGPESLLENGLVHYEGYDCQGNELKGNTDPYAFFEDWRIAPYRPVEWSFFLEERFSFKNLDVGVGLRMNRFDANQPVLRDKYSLYEIHTVSSTSPVSGMLHPSNVGPDFYVYVDNAASPSTVTGYRHGDDWYDASGNRIDDPSLLDAGMGISPYLKYPGIQLGGPRWTPEMTFRDYEPEWILLPEVNVSYLLAASGTGLHLNYNTWSQHPVSMNHFRPDYYLLFNQVSGLIPNPALKPYRTMKFSTGVRQKIIRGLYAGVEFLDIRTKDYFHINRILGAWPKDYWTIENYFSTIRNTGFHVSVDYLNQPASGFRSGFGYTILYPEKGAGFGQTLSSYLLFDFGYGPRFIDLAEGKTFESVFQNVGIGLFFTYRSGNPIATEAYLQDEMTDYPDFNILNLKIQKGFFIGKKGSQLDVYLWVENLFNRKNYFYLYPGTGLPDNDGYLAAPEWQHEINQQTDPEAFRDLYRLKLLDPEHYDIPSLTRMGVVWTL
ncbi:MAG: hypothetical protein JW861_03500, partial [Bacteroidales bacterium]|nr:hypothetical protein [Bacteroidales bacterium]